MTCQNQPKRPPGGRIQKPATCGKAPTGTSADDQDSKPATRSKAPTGSRSLCAGHHEKILESLEQGLSAQRIYQDLVTDHGFAGSYPSVRRYVAKLKSKTPLLYRRIEVGPGEEAQIDFGTGAMVIDENGKRRRTHVLRVS